PLVHESAVVLQVVWEWFSALHFAQKRILPTCAGPVLIMYHNALLATLSARSELNLEHFLVVLLPGMCGIICLEKVFHGGVSKVVRGLQHP
ncbi:hypothetical protein V1505DRAFT_290119, partial [Lipomyces doorenjongii]